MLRLNPYAKTMKRNALLNHQRSILRNDLIQAKREGKELPKPKSKFETHLTNLVNNHKPHKHAKRGLHKRNFIKTLLQ